MWSPHLFNMFRSSGLMLGAGRSKDVKLIMEVEPNLIGGLQVEWGYTDPQKRYAPTHGIDLSLKNILGKRALQKGVVEALWAIRRHRPYRHRMASALRVQQLPRVVRPRPGAILQGMFLRPWQAMQGLKKECGVKGPGCTCMSCMSCTSSISHVKLNTRHELTEHGDS